ncbi:MAG: archaellin/type IV pilin N-terminal domain-containing protein, partial [Candidatus Poseidoniaceae archaeon]
MRSNEFQHDEGDAVSPVIATILMVAITVVLAGVLYVWASSLAEGNTGGSLTFYQFDAEGDVGAITTGTDDPLVRITMTQGVAINWATVDVKISINNGAPITCDNPGNEGGAACALIEFGDSTDSEWSVGDGVTVVESGQDLCNAVCSVKITITDVREGRTIDESSAAIQGGTGGSGDGTTPSNDDQQSSGGCTEDSDCSGN